jgi:predicted DNA-binding transcriptional regulator YafY
MRGDQLARQWRIIRAIEASPNGLTATEIAQRKETGIRPIYRNLEALQAPGFPLFTKKIERPNRWAFIATFKSKILPAFALIPLVLLYFYKRLVCAALDQALPRYPVGRRAVELLRGSRAI